MNLDNLNLFKQLDSQSFLAQINGLPRQLDDAWNLGQRSPLPHFEDVQNIIVAAMGDSAIGADLAAVSAAPNIRLPLSVLRDYDLPAFADEKTLVVCVSHSGNSEEVLSIFESAQKSGCRLFVISSGGALTNLAQSANIPYWNFSYRGADTMGVAYPFALTLALFARLGFIPDPSAEIAEAIRVMDDYKTRLAAETPAVTNPAKRYAGQLVGRWVTLVASERLSPVARRWKTQINQLAKAAANFELIPEATHNALIGSVNPSAVLNAQTTTLFLRAQSEHPRNRLRSDLMRQAFMLEGLNTDTIEARGDSIIAQLWSLLIFGDYMAFYLAMAYGADPSEEEAFENLKRMLK